MKRNWIISIVTSIILVAAGVSGYFYIKDSIPAQLSEASALVQTGNDQKEEKPQSKALKDIISESQKKVVQIKLANGTQGSGFLYNDKGDVLTNAHVVANAKEVTVITSDSKELEGKVIGISTETDVAVIRVPGLEGKEPLEIATEDNVQVLDPVLALGSPLGLQNTVTRGEISGLDRNFEIDTFKYEGLYQISAPISAGNSGGPLIDSETGKVIGINSAKLDKESIGFSIPITDVLPLVKRWSESPMKSLPEFPHMADGGNADSAEVPIDQATYVVEYFYDSISKGDFVTAYSLLGSSRQSSTSYEEFRDGYSNTLSVTVDELIPEDNGKNVTVTAYITVEETVNGEVKPKKYKVTYVVGKENERAKLISGSGEELLPNKNGE
ncbi:S1C family serine protease [Thalassobacillus pellis]|uniref:S1C family serine protease n=1 Tax=Thalassobacillus pellis TaxID=748008 RepID=UPI0019605B5C|nr:trypsin-like peptidase domain-containing protein [Thalassobacillus pellis]MBM7553088.1 small nuclear ribonucleoprotein (snRNP)-like protein [Thalassobacillus pellis]